MANYGALLQTSQLSQNQDLHMKINSFFLHNMIQLTWIGLGIITKVKVKAAGDEVIGGGDDVKSGEKALRRRLC
jgi:hypothetical protein